MREITGQAKFADALLGGASKSSDGQQRDGLGTVLLSRVLCNWCDRVDLHMRIRMNLTVPNTLEY